MRVFRLFLILLPVFSMVVICRSQVAVDIKPAGKTGVEEISVVVADKDLTFVPGLKKEDFVLTIDGKERLIQSVEEVSGPSLHVIAVDTSGSMRTLLPNIVDGAKRAVAEEKAGDAIALMRFIGRDQIQITPKFTNDAAALNRVIDNFYIEGGLTALIDAIALSAKAFGNVQDKRKSILVITDGEERNSQTSYDNLVELLHASNVRVFFVGITAGLTGGEKNKARFLMTRLANSSGGMTLFSDKPEKISGEVSRIFKLMHSGYSLQFHSDDSVLPSSKIELSLVGKGKNDDYKLSHVKLAPK